LRTKNKRKASTLFFTFTLGGPSQRGAFYWKPSDASREALKEFATEVESGTVKRNDIINGEKS